MLKTYKIRIKRRLYAFPTRAERLFGSCRMLVRLMRNAYQTYIKHLSGSCRTLIRLMRNPRTAAVLTAAFGKDAQTAVYQRITKARRKALQKVAFCALKGNLLGGKRIPFRM